MTANVAIGNATGHPYGTIAPAFHHFALGIQHLLAFADEVHNPSLVGIHNGEGFALAGIAVRIHQFSNHLDSFAGVLGALQSNVNQGTVVNHALALLQLFNTAISGLADGQLPLIHVADHGIGVAHLRNLSKQLARVPFDHIHHGTFWIVLSWTIVEFAVQAVRIGSIGQETGAIFTGTLRHDEVGTSHGRAKRQQTDEHG